MEPAAAAPSAASLALRGELARHGVTAHLVDRRMALRPLITHRRKRTELRTLATGRVIGVEIEEEV